MLSNELICNKTRMIKCSGPVRTREEVETSVGVDVGVEVEVDGNSESE